MALNTYLSTTKDPPMTEPATRGLAASRERLGEAIGSLAGLATPRELALPTERAGSEGIRDEVAREGVEDPATRTVAFLRLTPPPGAAWRGGGPFRGARFIVLSERRPSVKIYAAMLQIAGSLEAYLSG